MYRKFNDMSSYKLPNALLRPINQLLPKMVFDQPPFSQLMLSKVDLKVLRDFRMCIVKLYF
jgi:hypothetical protein